MRLTLLFICLFSILGGCAASSSHGVVVPKLLSYSGKHQSATPGIFNKSLQSAELATDYFASDDIDDDDDRQLLAVKKCRCQANTATAFAQLAETRVYLPHHFSTAPVRGGLPRIYILQRVFRV